MNPAIRKLFLRLLAVVAFVYIGFGVFVWWAMRQSPETFGRIVAKMPITLISMVYPIEMLWTHARAGSLSIGDAAPGFSLMKVDKSETVSLAALNRQQPVVLVFGSYT